MEDTSFYVYNRLVALNEVGGDPRRFGVSVAAFHAAAQERQRDWPGEMLATSTHDNKRSEDVRARIAVLSEMPAAWRLALRRWARLNQRHETRRRAMSRRPTATTSICSIRPCSASGLRLSRMPASLDALRQRIHAYMRKAVREAKVHSSWASPDDAYETALASFIDGLLGRLEPNPFLHEFLPLHALVARCGLYNSLAQTVLKLSLTRRSRHLSGQRAVGLQPRRSGQSAAGRLRQAAHDAARDQALVRIRTVRMRCRHASCSNRSTTGGSSCMSSGGRWRCGRGSRACSSTDATLRSRSPGRMPRTSVRSLACTAAAAVLTVVPRLLLDLTRADGAPSARQHGLGRYSNRAAARGRNVPRRANRRDSRERAGGARRAYLPSPICSIRCPSPCSRARRCPSTATRAASAAPADAGLSS